MDKQAAKDYNAGQDAFNNPCHGCGAKALYKGADTLTHCGKCGATQNMNHHKH